VIVLLEGERAVVTGAGSDVGRASALRFAAEGALVVCADVQMERAKETARLVEAAGGVAVPQECDVSREGEVVAAIAAAVDRLAGLDIMFNGATKGAVHQLTRAVAIEGAPHGLRAHAICPNGIPYTNFTAAGGTEVAPDAMDQYAERMGSLNPLGRPIAAEACADAAVYLVSDLSANITGVLLPIDAGYVAR
jgi:NAD(P)-dependent dehydrogenase (short-subunit alcohol dehydrogenase family)